jgi:hypothetical protein
MPSLTSLPSSDNLFYVFAPQKTLRKNIKNLLSYAVRSGSLALRRLAAARTPRRSLARLSFEWRRARWRKLKPELYLEPCEPCGKKGDLEATLR